MASESLVDVLRDRSRPVFLLGSTPPREGTSVQKAQETCAKFTARAAVLATDGYIVYDIQDERSRIEAERPFPFRKTMDPSLYASMFPALSGKQCIVYKAVTGESAEQFDEWLDAACDKYNHHAFVLVGAASSKPAALSTEEAAVHAANLTLTEASKRTVARGGCAFGSVCIPERHSAKGNENINMLRKIGQGSEWFITQGIFAVEPVVRLINEYGDTCRQQHHIPKKVILTFAPCGREKTMSFIKWLGMFVPPEVESRVFSAASPVDESVKMLGEFLTEILTRTAGSGVPLGINVESLSIFKEEIDATHKLFQSLQAILLNTKGSPWAVRWFFVKPKSFYISARASDESLANRQVFYGSGGELNRITSGTSASITNTAGDNQSVAVVSTTTSSSNNSSKSGSESLLPNPKHSATSVALRHGQYQSGALEWVTVSLICLAMGIYLGKASATARR